MDINDKTLLITGGTGSFGNAVLNRFLKTNHFSEIRIFSRDEKKQDDLRKRVNNKVKLIINDFPEIATKLNCDGCHIGQKDLSIQQTKQIMKSNKIIGVTCHNSKELALSAEKYGASYLAFGSFFKTKTKKTKFKANPKLLQWAHKNLKTPVVAIGGINEENYKLLLQNGAKYIACSSYIWRNSKYNPLKALNQLK